ncbi:hypothetical protein LguiA_021637 [Lonicera macranthoides]
MNVKSSSCWTGTNHPPPPSPPPSSTLLIASSPMSTFLPIRTHHLSPSFQSLLSTSPHLLSVPPSPYLLRLKPSSRLLLLHRNGVLARAKGKAHSSSSPTSSSSTQQPNPNYNKQLQFSLRGWSLGEMPMNRWKFISQVKLNLCSQVIATRKHIARS